MGASAPGVLDAAAQPICVVDANGRIRFANAAAVAALGYDDAHELLGHDGSRLPVACVSVPLDMPGGSGALLAFADTRERPRTDRMRKRAVRLAEEQDSLRRVAALAAQGAPAAEMFATVAAEVARVMHLPIVAVCRYDADGATMTVIGEWGDRSHPFGPGTRWPIGRASVSAQVLRTGRPARVDDGAELPGSIAAGARDCAAETVAGAPIIVDGRVWGVMATASPDAPIPDGLEDRLADFTALIAIAISNTQAREDLRGLADEQAALRRVATLVAEGGTPAQVFSAVAREVAAVMRLPMACVSRYDDDGAAATVVGAGGDRPGLFQAGKRWPLDGPSIAERVLRTGRPARFEDYTGIPGTVGDACRRLGFQAGVGAPIVVDGQLWGLVGAGADPGQPMPADAERRLSQFTALVATAISNSQAREDLRGLADQQAALRRVATLVAQGAMPAEVFSAVAREVALVLKLPMAGMYRYEPDGTATVVGSRGEQAFQPGTNWPLDGASLSSLVRTTGRPARIDDYADVTGTIGEAAARAGVRAGVGAPIIVDGELWGMVGAGADRRELVPPDAERRLSQFTALVASAISNTQAREDLRRLADEQAALRRLATLVARAAEPQVVFDAVCEETGRLLGASSVHLARSLSDGLHHAVAGWSERDDAARRGGGLSPDGQVVVALVRDTAAPGRVESDGGPGSARADLGRHSSVGAPVVVEGRVWGALVAARTGPGRLPAATEHRLASFAELIATAVSNAAARAELVASRVRIVEAADEQRRRVVRDLHDGAQERMIHAIFALQRAHDRDDAPPDVRLLVEEGVTHVRSAIAELRELAHGIHPEILTQQGLAAAVQPLADRASLPVEIEVPEERYPTPVESAAYFVAAEALTNVAKYARASTARITATRTPAGLRLVVEDDGVGGAKRMPGRGLAGLGDRLAALDGALSVDSPPGGGTLIRAEIPLRARG
ncbi:MAG: putative GAF-sensor signal transduction histidine kinase [Solirubrobacterales bacterium]|nr:putative GAF-sensor signal transduction histidine kinase [Solirubrobacterales bacterium]